MRALLHSNSFHNLLEDTLSITERRDMTSSVLLIHSLSSKLLSNHITNNTHHSSTSVIQFNIKLTGLFIRVSIIRTKVTNTIITVILRCRHPCEFHQSKERQDLCKSSSRDSKNTVNTSWDIGEFK